MIFRRLFRIPLRFLVAAAVVALLLCLLPAKVNETKVSSAPPEAAQREAQLVSVGADLSEKTGPDTYAHRTLFYAPCGHSVQRREKLDARFVGLTRSALESALAEALPGAFVTGFSAAEVDISLRTDIPCPLHWVLKTGDDGHLVVWQNLTGETLEPLRRTDVPARNAPDEEQAALLEGRIFDDAQALEGYLESLSS